MSDEWLKKLKVGDRVIVCTSNSRRFATVSKTTPSGRIEAGGGKFNNRGDSVPYERYHGSWLSEATPEAVAEIEIRVRRGNLESDVRCMNINDLTDSQLAHIVAILNEPKEQGEGK